ncbi:MULTISPECIES: hypothetical protein [unclassified Paenibacillus]|uniref:hypothetical protein n=1 Tax=unclassified Paenibacillus TaxID=185978 RepID=UPI00020D7073|nr:MULTISPECIES: hypothetical protein [unclassified Paenibacillus]EGL18121.1 hypothetical protein HMPREF9413_5959 [Paenibacillus sp. HGF7]EPD88077.1 hypothetical protein HMPREF1207_02619 [Paenibacillus sp. HGH0039]
MANHEQNEQKPKSYAPNQYEPRQREDDDVPLEVTGSSVNRKSSSNGKISNKHRFWIGITALITFGMGMYFQGSTGSIKDVQSNGIGKGMKAGIQLAAADDSAGLEARDFEIEMKKNTTTSRMLIWDFAAEDGDVVTVKVDGNILQANINIMHNPVFLDIPIPSVVEITGVKDGGGGITYGVKFPGAVQNNAYFNAAPVGSSNVYTITGQ